MSVALRVVTTSTALVRRRCTWTSVMSARATVRRRPLWRSRSSRRSFITTSWSPMRSMSVASTVGRSSMTGRSCFGRWAAAAASTPVVTRAGPPVGHHDAGRRGRPRDDGRAASVGRRVVVAMASARARGGRAVARSAAAGSGGVAGGAPPAATGRASGRGARRRAGAGARRGGRGSPGRGRRDRRRAGRARGPGRGRRPRCGAGRATAASWRDATSRAASWAARWSSSWIGWVRSATLVSSASEGR